MTYPPATLEYVAAQISADQAAGEAIAQLLAGLALDPDDEAAGRLLHSLEWEQPQSPQAHAAWGDRRADYISRARSFRALL